MDTEGDGDSGGLMFVQVEGSDGGNYRYAIDPSTGSLYMMQVGESFTDPEAASAAETGGVHDGGIDTAAVQTQVLTVIKVLQSGEYALETVDSLHHLRLQEGSNEIEGRAMKLEELQLPLEHPEQEYQADHQEEAEITTAVASPARKGSLWSSTKTDDLVHCIQKNELNFKKWPKRMKVWSAIAADMRELGHSACDKDECNKKWSNLERQYRKVRLRPPGERAKWKYYDEVSKLVRSISFRQRVNTSSGLKNGSGWGSSTQDSMMRLIAVTKSHQEAVRAAEDEFKLKVSKLDEERDKILCDIKQMLQCKLSHNEKNETS